jgi:hypothetical protein
MSDHGEQIELTMSIDIDEATGRPVLVLQFEHGYLSIPSPDTALALAESIREMAGYLRDAIGRMN